VSKPKLCRVARRDHWAVLVGVAGRRQQLVVVVVVVVLVVVVPIGEDGRTGHIPKKQGAHGMVSWLCCCCCCC